MAPCPPALVTALLGLLLIANRVHGECQLTYHAQSVPYDAAAKLDFYYTKLDVPSMEECARFCGRRSFCRTAIYNTFALTCAISYGLTVDCRATMERNMEFQPHRMDHLVQLTCVKACNQENRTGDAHPCYRRIEGKFLLGADFQRHPSVSVDECRCLCAETWRDPDIPNCRSFVYYKNFDCVLNRDNHRGKYDLVEDDEADYQYVACDEESLIEITAQLCRPRDESSGARREGVTDESLSSAIPFVSPQAFLNTLEMKKTRSAEEATTKRSDSRTTSPFITESPEIEAFLTSHIETTTTSAFVTDTPKEETTTERKTEEVTSPFVTEAPEGDVSTTIKATRATSEATTATERSTTTTTEELSTGTEVVAVSISSTATKEDSLITTKEITSTTTEESEEDATADDVDGSGTSPVVLPETTTTPYYAPFPTEAETCFEEIREFTMSGTAGGLEHDVSLEECKCFCANSRASGRYAFDCLSATYYHNERDCVLNVHSRETRPDLFTRIYDRSYFVSYIGVVCDIQSARREIVNPLLEYGCMNVQPTTTTTTTTTPAPFTRSGESDSCFLELPSFVLEGNAFAVEVGVSVTDCKCHCVVSEEVRGETCLSFQFYSDSHTCLLSKNNRISNPESFSFTPNAAQQSYFEYKCATRKQVRETYLEERCLRFLPKKKSSSAATQDDTPLVKKEKESNKKTTKAPKNDNWKEKKEKKEKKTTTASTTKKPSTTTSSSTSSSARTTSPSTTTEVPSATEEQTTTTTSASSAETTTSKVDDIISPHPGMKTKPEEIPLKQLHKLHRRRRPPPKSKIPEAEEEEYYDEEETREIERKEEEEKKKVKEEGSEKEEREENSSHSPKDADKEKPQMDDPSKVNRIEASIEEPTSTDKVKVVKPKPGPSTSTTEASLTTTTIVSSNTTSGNSSEVSEKDVMEIMKAITSTERTLPPRKTTTPTTTTTTTTYPSAGRCTYSAIYQTTFTGRFLIKTVTVTSPADCFAACYALHCRSANLLNLGGRRNLKSCELFRDSLIDYRRPDVLGYDGSSVYFDGIQCSGEDE